MNLKDRIAPFCKNSTVEDILHAILDCHMCTDVKIELILKL
jgi:hypothetical protein